MALRVRTLALWCAVVACATAYTVDCNHEYTDCDTELSKLVSDDEEGQSVVTTPSIKEVRPTTTAATPTRSTPRINENVLENKTVEITTEQNEVTETIVKPKPRLLNLNVDELQNFANALHNQTNQREPKKNIDDLSDVNMDGDDDDDEPPKILVQERKQNHIPDKFYSNLQAPFHPLLNMDKSDEIETCKVNEVTYKLGERMDRGCEETCECSPGGVFECSPRCKHPYIRRGRRINDPLCFESPVDECCSIMACATNNGDLKPTSLEICRYGNDTYHVGAKWNIGCEQTCTCERNSIVTCKPRCQRIAQSDRCINVQDPNDACCEIQICDVSQDVHEEPMDNVTVSTSTTQGPAHEKNSMESSKSTMRPLVLLEPIGSIKVLQNNSVQVNLIHPNDTEDPIHLLLSSDGGKSYQDVELRYSNLILNLEGGKDYILKTKETGTKFNFTITASDVGNELPDEELYNVTKDGCYHDGQFYAVGEEFNIGCTELCECTGQDTRECAPLHCPNHVGLELVSKGCVKWAPNPPPQPPNCCPRTARCLSDGTCHYEGVAIPNWSEVPIALSGCEQHCFCENGELDCQEACSPLPPLPPQTLRCPPMHRPAPVNISNDEDCCKEWGCVPHGQLPPGFPGKQPPGFLPTIPPDNRYPSEDNPLEDYEQNNIRRPIDNPLEPALAGLPPGLPLPSFGEENKKLTVISLQSDSPTSIKMLFGLPPVLVGLRGSVDLRYTDTDDDDVGQWYSQVFAPADEILTTPRLEFRLSGLKPSTMYRIRGKLYLHNLPVEPESKIYTIRTQDLPSAEPAEEKRREIDCKLRVVDVNDTTAHLTWRHFTEEELQFIDGVQVRYRPVGTPIYSMTELLHHSRSAADLIDLRPGSKYEASMVLIPPTRSATELFDSGRVEFVTSPYIDPYNWTVTVEARTVGSEAAELTWRGVPSPAERWVRVYRAAHACGARKEHDDFRLATRDLPPAITLIGLEPNSRCRVWLELFLTNGKVKTSNVLEIHTKSLDSPEPVDNEIEASSIAGSRGAPRGDYYGALVIVGVVAALGALTSVLLLLVVVRRHRPHSVPITPVPTAPRESSLPPYDNPAYKLELQQETMDL
ncbi:putative epidermal cell surface receptor [Colias croceus]|uniref:putative epidermal cell surface receptor n=1 Tax=Colias crocea TaxID=72248 RepID=UPI001E281099|nr:putative epidermal cell surface receptor [Colias croceus]